MTTLALLKAEIADDLDRTDLTTAIASEITKAIGFFQDTRFWFNETRDCVIATAANQRLYSDEGVEGIVYRVVLDSNDEIVEDENGDIILFAEDSDTTAVGDALSDFITVDQVRLEGANGYDLEPISPKDWEALTASGDETGKPTHWCYFGGAFGLYPIPDAQYAVRFIGHVRKAAPASDAEANNVWMIHAFDLIRSQVCARLALRKLRDQELAAINVALVEQEKQQLLSETASKTGTGFITPTEF